MKGSRGMNALKVGVLALLAIAVVALAILRVTGLEPASVPPSTVVPRPIRVFVRPGLWQRGEVVTTPVTDWSFVSKFPTAVLQTQTRYFIPHSVRLSPRVHNNQLYITSGQTRFDKPFPTDKGWTANVARDPRVRLKVGDKIYELTLVLVADRAEVAAALGPNREVIKKGPKGEPRLEAYVHVFRAFQRNVPEYGPGRGPEESARAVPPLFQP